MAIHPTSIISKEAVIADNVEIGPFCVVKGKVKIGEGCVLESHVSIGNEWGSVEIGKHNRVSSGAQIGGPPQDLSYRGEATRLTIGDHNIIRELATINCGTAKGGGLTKIGSHCMIMSYAHVAHDCEIGDYCVIANLTQLAGHVVFEDHVKANGMCGFNQFVRVGKHAFLAGGSEVNKDILPFGIAQGKYATVRAPNKVGLERAGYPKEEIESIKRAVRIITVGDGTLEERLARINAECPTGPLVEYFKEFAKNSLAGPRGLAL